MKKILLTGGSGFIGKNIKESYLRQKYEIISPSHAELDLSDTKAVDAYFADKHFDAVIHAAIKPVHRNAADRKDLLKTNLLMFENLERNKTQFDKFINLGSGAVYDVAANNTNVSETEIFSRIGNDDVSFCKYVIAKQIEKLPNFVDLNIFGIFGKYEDYAIRFISNAICKTLFGLPITLRQNRRFSYLYVNDLMPIIEFFIENIPQHKHYNITPDMPIELAEITEIVKSFSKENVEIRIAKDGLGADYYGNNFRLRKEIPDIKFTPIKEAIAELFGYYKNIKEDIDFPCLLNDK